MTVKYDEPLTDEDFPPGDDGEEMESHRGCGGKRYRMGCSCEDCADRGDIEYHAMIDRKLERGEL